MESMQEIDVRLPGRFKIGTKTAFSVLFFIGTLGVTAFWLYSDKHNSDLFLPRTEYAKDQEQREKDQSRIIEQLEKSDKRQEEIQRDVKEILKQRK